MSFFFSCFGLSATKHLGCPAGDSHGGNGSSDTEYEQKYPLPLKFIPCREQPYTGREKEEGQVVQKKTGNIFNLPGPYDF